ncbi:VOC family protein [Cryobacterium sp. PAMC25264]|uniref:VOC family protein n=1 Tax=Cryobacterium sp. PAMC25264 TaxID=2861288 RepID=UPI001C63B48C|nr:VOC family protein [Cryobacterium sp. PAMC25264]QYF74475.1 VOC family protein [Cryobacterium sp. PAMC25264]
MSLKWEEVVVDSRDPRTLGLWWRDALGWALLHESDDELEIAPAEGAHPTVLFVAVPDEKTVKNRLHLDFVPDDQAAEVDRLVAMGASRVDIGQAHVPWVVLADPEGNEFCVLAARPGSPD